MTNLVLRSDKAQSASMDGRFLSALHQTLLETEPVPKAAGRVFATESISEAESYAIATAGQTLQSALAAVVNQMNMGADQPEIVRRATFVAETAAVMGGLSAADAGAFLGRSMAFEAASSENVFAMPATSVPDYLGKRSSKVMAMEAFDNRETRSAVLYTMAYNYTLARQDEFGETVWPTLTLPADQVGFGIVVNRLTVYRGITRTTDGKAANFGKIDLMRAARNYKVLQKEKTRLYPIVRSNNTGAFVDASLIAPAAKDVDGNSVITAPYSMNIDHDVIGLAQTDAALAGGSANQTDTLDPNIIVETLYAKIGSDIVAFNVRAHPSANFTYAPQGLDKQRNLAFNSKAVTLGPDSLTVTGAALSTLAVLAAKKYSVILNVQAYGQANTEFSNVQVTSQPVQLLKVVDDQGVALAETDPDVQDLRTAFQGAITIGYDLRAWRTNINMRDRGDFIDRSSFTQLFEIPLLSPVTAQRPQSSDGQLDAGDFEALVTTTRFRLMNDAVTSLLEAFDQIDEFAKNKAGLEDRPSFLGAARFHVQPTVFSDSIDMTKVVDSLTSTNRPEDLANALVNIIRDYAFRMYVYSEYPAAQAALGMTDTATVVIATDPIIHRYIMLKAELRTLTEKFNVKVVSSIDARMQGKIFLTFGVFDENRNQAPNILNFGQLVWAPEVVMSASVPRGESMSRETIVQPRYRFIWNCPIITKLEISGIPDVMMGKLPLDVHSL